MVMLGSPDETAETGSSHHFSTPKKRLICTPARPYVGTPKIPSSTVLCLPALPAPSPQITRLRGLGEEPATRSRRGGRREEEERITVAARNQSGRRVANNGSACHSSGRCRAPPRGARLPPRRRGHRRVPGAPQVHASSQHYRPPRPRRRPPRPPPRRRRRAPRRPRPPHRQRVRAHSLPPSSPPRATGFGSPRRAGRFARSKTGPTRASRRLYYTKIEIGTPPKQYHVQVDTGSDILWVNCITCDKCPKKSGLGVISLPTCCYHTFSQKWSPLALLLIPCSEL
jgi:hypothetical protein